MKNFTRLLFILICVISLNAAEQPFKLTKSYNIYGNYKMIGNTALELDKNKNVSGHITSLDGIKGYDIKNGKIQYEYYNYFGQYVGNIAANNFSYLKYVDIDNNSLTYNSSSSDLTIPAGSQIVYARLYWNGLIKNTNADIQKAKNIKIKIDNNNYINLSVTTNNFDTTQGFTISSNTKFPSYLAYKDVTNLFTHLSSFNNLKVTVANVECLEGWEYGIGNYGAWSLVVIYKNKNESFKNISLFSGFGIVDGYHSTKIDISGFYTPISGAIHSSISVFAGEGDIAFTGDRLLIQNKNKKYLDVTKNIKYPNAKNNIFDSTITNNETRNPDIQNNMGIDIDTFPIGIDGNTTHPQIIGNSQTSTKIKATTDGDVYTINSIVFATDLYVPKVCYDNLRFYDQNGNLITSGSKITTNSKIRVKFDIKNMDNAYAKNVFVKNTFDDNLTSYVPNSTNIKNVLTNNFIHINDNQTNNNLGVYYSDNNKTWNIGILGDTDNVFKSTLSNPKYIATVEFNTTIKNEGNITFNFNTNYIYSIDNKTFTYNDILPKCSNFNSNISSYTPTSGNFNVVEPTFNSAIDPKDNNNSLNAIHTKIVNKPFNIKVIHLKNDNETLSNFTGIVEVNLIKNPTNENECSTNPSLYTKFVTFSNSKEENILNITYPKALQDARFRIRYLTDKNGNIIQLPSECINLGKIYTNSKTYTQTNNISSAQNTYQNTIQNAYGCANGLATKGINIGKCTANCVKSNNNIGQCVMECIFGWENTNTKSICSRDNFSIRPYKFKISSPSTPIKAGAEFNLTISALDYKGEPTANYNQILNIKGNSPSIEYKDKKTTCITGKLSNTIPLQFINGTAIVKLKYPEVGDLNISVKENNDSYEFAKVDAKDTPLNNLLIQSDSKLISFIPDKFDIKINSVNNFNNSNFTYLSQDLNMSGDINATIQAVNTDNEITQNYTNGCYAQNVDINISHKSNTKMDNLNKIITQFGENDKDKNISFTLPNTDFTKGQSNLKIDINFDRNSSKGKEVEPFDLNLTSISAIDSNNTKGSSNIDKLLHFVYGRVDVQNVTTNNAIVDLFVPFEIWKNGNWVVNSEHNSSNYGDINNSYHTSNIFISYNTNTISNGQQDITITKNTTQTPYKETIHFSIPTWLWYSIYSKDYKAPSKTNTDCKTHPCSNVLWNGSSYSWAGTGTNEPDNNVTKKTVTSHIENNTTKNKSFHKINW